MNNLQIELDSFIENKKNKETQNYGLSFKKDNPKTKIVKFIDLFAGMGGLRLGFEQAFKEKGFTPECVLTSEIKPHAIEALRNNFEHSLMVGDITKVNAEEIPEFDILLGGFPCQAFSTAGNRLGFADTRGTLFFEVERILKAKKPYAFILENVEGLVTHDLEKKGDKVGRTLKVILKALEDIGYSVNWEVLDSQDFGVAQSRKRIFIVGTLDKRVDLTGFSKVSKTFGEVMEHNLPVVDSHFTRCLLSHYTKEQIYGKAIKDKRGGANNIHSWDIELKGSVSDEQKNLLELLFKQRRYKRWAEEIGIKWMDGMPLTLAQISTFYNNENLKEMLDDLVEKGYLKLEHPKAEVIIIDEDGKEKKIRQQDETKEKGYNIVAGKLSFEFSEILDPNHIAPTLVATDVNKLGVVDADGIRRLTLREGLRLFGYPETYSLEFFNGDDKEINKGFDLLGNTVVVNVVKSVAQRLADKII